MDITNRSAILRVGSLEISVQKAGMLVLISMLIYVLLVAGCTTGPEDMANTRAVSKPTLPEIGNRLGQKIPETTLLLEDYSERSLTAVTQGKPSLLYFFTSW